MAVFLTWLTQRQTGGDRTVAGDVAAVPAPGDPRAGASASLAPAAVAPQGERQD